MTPALYFQYEDGAIMKAFSKIMLMSLLSALLLAVLSPLSSYAAPSTPPGSGTEADPYLISTVSNLEWMVDQVNNNGNDFSGNYLKLVNNIDASGWNATPIGDVATPFNGTFEGNYKMISNLTINDPELPRAGLFGYIEYGGKVKNLGLDNVKITGKNFAGGIAASSNGYITACYVTGSVSAVDTGSRAGGIIGENFGHVHDSYSIASVSGSMVGGFIGENIYGQILNSYWSTDSNILQNGTPQSPKIGIGINAGGAPVSGLTSEEMQNATFATTLNTNSVTGAEWVSSPEYNMSYPVFLAMIEGGTDSGGDGEGSGSTGGGTGGIGDTGGSGGTGGTGGTIGGGVTQDFDIVGTVDATWIIVTVPTTVSFAILPDASDKSFVSVPFQVLNQSNAPIDVKFLGMHSTGQTSTKVVNADKYSDQGWLKLPASKSSSEIALGINLDGKTIWSPAETQDQVPDTVVGLIRLDRLGTKQLSLDGKHGRAFTESKVMSYQMYLRVGLAS